MTSILKVEGLSHKYNSTWAIRDINIEIDRYGAVGLLGSNGAGKSTTMNILCGSLSQTEDSIQNARRYYNAVVRDLNTKIQSFPTNFLAGMFGFQQKQFFETTEADREPVAVKF